MNISSADLEQIDQDLVDNIWISDANHESTSKKDAYVDGAMEHLQSLGMFTASPASNSPVQQSYFYPPAATSNYWNKELENMRKIKILQNREQPIDNSKCTGISSRLEEINQGECSSRLNQSGSASVVTLPTLSEFGQRYQLNQKQQCIFNIIGDHLHQTLNDSNQKPEQLLLIVTGEAGMILVFVIF